LNRSYENNSYNQRKLGENLSGENKQKKFIRGKLKSHTEKSPNVFIKASTEEFNKGTPTSPRFL